MKSFESLMKDVARAVQGDARRRQLLPEIRRRIAAMDGARAPRVRRVRWVLAGAGGALVLGGVATVAVLMSQPRGLSFVAVAGEGGTPQAGQVGVPLGARAAGDDREVGLRFSDGSRVTLPPRARAAVESLDVKGASVAIERGTVDVSVVHRAETQWQVRAGRYRIQVTGTRFAAGWDPARRALTVTMREGAVLVTGPGIAAPIPVVGGQRLRVREGDSRIQLDDARAPLPAGDGEAAAPSASSSPAPSSPDAPPASVPAAASPGPAATTRAPIARETARRERGPAPRARRSVAVASASGARGARSDADWRELAARGRYKAALDAVLTGGAWRDGLARLGAEDVVLLGDVARLAGDADRAEEAYGAARRRFPGADRPVFSLGRIAFEQRRDFAAAASWFDSYVHLFPRGPLVREAAGRLLEARLKGGDGAGARAAATAYLRGYPTGPHAGLARRTVGP